MKAEGRQTRVLEVCTVPTERSGIPNVIFNLIRNADRTQTKIGYVSINEPEEEYKDELARLGIDLYVIPRKLSSPWQYVSRLSRLAKGYDVMHVHGNSATMVLEMLAARIAGVRVRAAHSHNSSCRMKTIHKAASPLFHKLCNLNLACGKLAGQWLFGNRDFSVIRNGIDTNRFRFNPSARQQIREDLGMKDQTVIGCVANFVPAKNHGFILRIFACIQKKDKDARLLLVGDGPLRNQLYSEAKSLGIENQVIFSGSVSNPEDYLSAMDLVLMPSFHEGLPLTLVEAQANGLRAVVSDNVTEEVNLTGKMLFLSLSDNEEYWSNEILKLLPLIRRDDEESDKSIERIKRAGFDIRESVSNLSALFKKALP